MIRRSFLIFAFVLTLVTHITLFSSHVLLLVNGALGDRSFFDSAAEGIRILNSEMDHQTTIIEMGYNPADWEPVFLEVSASGRYDVITVGGWPFVEILQRHAPSYPHISFILFDTAFPRDNARFENVQSFRFHQNEGAFLVGYLASMITLSEGISGVIPDQKKIGFLGGLETPEVLDFLVGYQEGAKHFSKDVEILVAFAGSFKDPVKGKEIARSLYHQNVDVIFAVAGETGIGVFEAAKETNRLAIGVDSDIQLLFESKDPEIVACVVTSLLKRIDLGIIDAVKTISQTDQVFGIDRSYGIFDGMIGLSDNRYFEAFLNQHPWIRANLLMVTEQILLNEIVIPTAIP